MNARSMFIEDKAEEASDDEFEDGMKEMMIERLEVRRRMYYKDEELKRRNDQERSALEHLERAEEEE